MQAERIETLLAQLTQEQRQDYERLLSELSSHDGDLSQLSSDDQQKLAKLSAALNPQEESIEQVSVDTPTVNVNTTDEEPITLGRAPEISPTTTPFGIYVVEQLKVLCEGGSSMADAVRYSFHNKYLPVALRDESICQQIYQRHQIEINDLTSSIQSVNKEQQKEAKVIVGLAWFAMLYQCYQYVEAYGDLH